ncbi:hypothetical protein V8G54_018739 [Vigna mungo]|uniref:Retrotransposon gag domain-containing protein n=1 Tax=Vigna mungo TaxID=3915 RepID=A0AAQ3NAF7_VIGMU
MLLREVPFFSFSRFLFRGARRDVFLMAGATVHYEGKSRVACDLGILRFSSKTIHTISKKNQQPLLEGLSNRRGRRIRRPSRENSPSPEKLLQFSLETSAQDIEEMANQPPPRRTLGDSSNTVGPLHFNSIAIPADNATNMVMNPALIQLVQSNQFHGLSNENPYNHLTIFGEICNIVKMKKFRMTGSNLACFLSLLEEMLKIGCIHSQKVHSELGRQCQNNLSLNSFRKRRSIKGSWKFLHFKQGMEETLGQAWDKFKGLLRKTPVHGFDKTSYLLAFLGGLHTQSKMMLDASAGGSINRKTEDEAYELIEEMTMNEVTQSERGIQKGGLLQLPADDAMAAQNHLLTQKLDKLTKVISELSKGIRNISQTQQLCDLCGGDHINGQCAQANANQGNSSKGWNNHPSIGQNQNTSSGQGGNFRQQQPSPLCLNDRFDRFLKVYESQQASDQASFRTLETQIGQLSKRVEAIEKNQFRANTDVNPNEEEIIEIESSEEEDEGMMSVDEFKEQKSSKDKEKEEENGKEKESLQEPFREIFNQVAVTPLVLPQIPDYDKRIKYYLGEVIDLDDEEDKKRVVKPRKKDHPPKLKDLGNLTLPCVINNVDIGRAMIDSGASVNLMPFSDFKKIGGLKLKPANTTLTVADGSIKKPIGMVENAIVQIEELEFLIDFLVVDMANEGRIPLILGRPFMRTSKMVIHVHDGRMLLKDQDQELTYSGFEDKKMRIRRRFRYKRARSEAAKEENTTGIDNLNSCNILQTLEEKIDKGKSTHSEDTPLLHGMSVRYKNRKWIVDKKLKEEGMVEIRRPYSTAIRRVEKRQLRSWDDGDPNMKKI